VLECLHCGKTVKAQPPAVVLGALCPACKAALLIKAAPASGMATIGLVLALLSPMCGLLGETGYVLYFALAGLGILFGIGGLLDVRMRGRRGEVRAAWAIGLPLLSFAIMLILVPAV
jgi:hypothetical protein